MRRLSDPHIRAYLVPPWRTRVSKVSLMERITFRLGEGTLKRIDRQVNRGEYPNRSEALRQYAREGVKDDEADEDGRPRPLALDTTEDD